MSSGIHEGLTFGSGELDFNGFWSIPCAVCARDFERRHPEEAPCWPFDDDAHDAERDASKRPETDPDGLRDHPEFAFAVFDDNLDVMGSGKGHLYTREMAEQRAGKRKKEGT